MYQNPPGHHKSLTALACTVAVAVAGYALIAIPKPAAAEPSAGLTITLSEASQPKLERPQLDTLKKDAAREGISLEEAVKSLAATKKPDKGVTLPDIAIDDLSVTKLTDLGQMAKSGGVSLEKAIDLYGWQDQFTEATLKIRALLPGQIAGVAIRDTKDGDRAGWIGFKGDVPDAAVKIAKLIPAEVELVGNKGYSEEDLQAELERAARELPSGPLKMLGYDIQTGVIDIAVDPEIALSSAGEKAALQTRFTPSASRIPAITFNVSVREIDHTLTDDFARGGGYANNGDGSRGCTMGFNITKNGTHSPTTAGHCASDTCTIDAPACKRQYQNHGGDGSSATTINFKLRHYGNYGDFARYGPGSFNATDTFYYDWSSKRYVDSAASSGDIYPGKNVCKFGRASGASCGTVFQTGLRLGGIGYLVSTNNNKLIGGDSGGPWYWGNEAIGMSHGYVGYSDGVNRDLFSPVHLIPSALNDWKVRLH